MARLTTQFQVAYLIRKIHADGGFGCILAKGDEHGGGLLIQCLDSGGPPFFLERRIDFNDEWSFHKVGPSGESSHIGAAEYVERRRKSDSDLWVIELDIAKVEQFIVETAGFS